MIQPISDAAAMISGTAFSRLAQHIAIAWPACPAPSRAAERAAIPAALMTSSTSACLAARWSVGSSCSVARFSCRHMPPCGPLILCSHPKRQHSSSHLESPPVIWGLMHALMLLTKPFKSAIAVVSGCWTGQKMHWRPDDTASRIEHWAMHVS